MKVLHINTVDVAGGAETLVHDLHRALSRLGHDSTALVGRREHGLDGYVGLADLFPAPRVPLLENAERAVRRQVGRIHGARPAADLLAALGNPVASVRAVVRRLDRFLGAEDFHYPDSGRIPRAVAAPDILQLHNLHGGYFDLRRLPYLSRWAPCSITLHDLWFLTGYCTCAVHCDDQWRSGCGACPLVSNDTRIALDRTRANLEKKVDIVRRARPYVVVPSRWLAQQVAHAPIGTVVGALRVIPHGIDQTVFHPGDRAAARRRLGLPEDAFVVLTAGQALLSNPVKNQQAVERALESVSGELRRDVVFVRLGDTGPDRRVGRVTMIVRPFSTDRSSVADYYRAADVYAHPSRKDVWGLSVTEAMACGLPVIGGNVGGIPDQIRSFGELDRRTAGERADRADATGVLVEPDDIEAIGAALLRLASDEDLLLTLGRNAAARAARLFNSARMARDYADWYDEIRADWTARRSPADRSPSQFKRP